ncbi:MAG: ATP-binding cassette domain-containing protein [Pigeon pea little leaf phytoplasma]|nr:ATP-binding cassette domain-containing protein [Pigeon pea little leaf phytoplasma]
MFLVCKNITKIFKSKKNFISVLESINFSLPSKGLVFIIGKSGSGKTTLMNILGGLETNTNGDVWFKNKSLSNLSENELNNYRNQSVGFIFQNFNLINDLTVFQNITIALELQNRPVDDILINNILDLVDLNGFGKRDVKELSGGQKQRVSIARAIIKEPDFLLADEPTGSLDSITEKQILELFKKISNQKLIILVSHNLEIAYNYADRIIEIKDGKIIKDNIRNSQNIFIDVLNCNKNNQESINSKSINFLKTTFKLFSRSSFCMALNHMKLKIVSLFLNIILTTIFFALLGLILAMYFYQSPQVIKSIFKNNYEQNFIFTKGLDDKNIMLPITWNEFDSLKRKNPKINLQPIISVCYWKNLLFNKLTEDNNYLNFNLFYNNKILFDLLETSESEKFWKAIGYQKPMNFDKNKIYVSRHLDEFLKSCAKPDIIYTQSSLFNELLDIILNKPRELIETVNENQYLIRFQYYNNFHQKQYKLLQNNKQKFLHTIKLLFLDQYYEEEEEFGNKNIVLLPKSIINKIITSEIMQKGYEENKIFNFFKIIGCTQNLSHNEINDLVDDYHYCFEMNNNQNNNFRQKKINFILSRTPFIRLFNTIDQGILQLALPYVFGIACLLAIFVVIMIIIFTNNSIKLRYRDIGILKALGAGKIYILSIFLTEIAIIFFINLILSSVVIKFFLFQINNWFISYFSIPILISNLRVYIYVFALGLIFYLLSTFIQIIKIIFKKPIDIINEK